MTTTQDVPRNGDWIGRCILGHLPPLRRNEFGERSETVRQAERREDSVPLVMKSPRQTVPIVLSAEMYACSRGDHPV